MEEETFGCKMGIGPVSLGGTTFAVPIPQVVTAE